MGDWFSNSYAHMLGGKDLYQNARRFGFNNLANFLESEYNKRDLRANEIEGILSGVPFIGDVLRGVQGVQSMEDLYNRTGKTAAYGALQNLGSAGLGYAAANVAKIASGTRDLYQFYSGEPDQFRQMQNGMYG